MIQFGAPNPCGSAREVAAELEMWGVVPAAGRGTRIQPLAFSKELLPVGSCRKGDGERPCAVSEYLVERMILAGVDKLCLRDRPGKSDIIELLRRWLRAPRWSPMWCNPRPLACAMRFSSCPSSWATSRSLSGSPTRSGSRKDGFRRASRRQALLPASFLSRAPNFSTRSFSAGIASSKIEVKQPGDASRWVWGAFKMPARVFHELHALLEARGAAR